MSSFDEFNEMARDVLSDPDLCSNAILKVANTEPNPDKPWEQIVGTPISYPVTCFYYKPKNNMINGNVVTTGQKAVLVQLSVPEASLLLATWIDDVGKIWQVKTFEKTELNDKAIMFKLLIGV